MFGQMNIIHKPFCSAEICQELMGRIDGWVVFFFSSGDDDNDEEKHDADDDNNNDHYCTTIS